MAENTGLYLTAMVGIVAVVAVVILTMSADGKQAELSLGDVASEDLSGQARMALQSQMGQRQIGAQRSLEAADRARTATASNALQQAAARFNTQGMMITPGRYGGLVYNDARLFAIIGSMMGSGSGGSGFNFDLFKNEVGHSCPPEPPVICTEPTDDKRKCRDGCDKGGGICWCKDHIGDLSNLINEAGFVNEMEFANALEQFRNLNANVLTQQNVQMINQVLNSIRL